VPEVALEVSLGKSGLPLALGGDYERMTSHSEIILPIQTPGATCPINALIGNSPTSPAQNPLIFHLLCGIIQLVTIDRQVL
jgi:hypothetical protein